MQLFVLKEEEGEGSGNGSERDSDMEFEQMLQEAEEPSNNKAAQETAAPAGESSDQPAQPRRKAKTKIGNKTKKKKKVKGSGKPDGEEQYEVHLFTYFVIFF